MNTNWAKVLLFSLLSFALGVILCMLMCGRCGGGWCGTKSACTKDAQCAHGAMGSCGHGAHGMGACCKGGAHGMEGHHGDGPAHGIVKELEAADFQGDTTIAIEGGTVNVKRSGNRTEVRVMMQDSIAVQKP